MKGIWFDDIHSYDDLNLVLSGVSISPATPKTTYVDIPGGDGSVDLTEALGEVKYKIRDLKFTFTVHPLDTMSFDEKCTEVANVLNGRMFNKITLDRDDEYYWTGRCTVTGYTQDKNIKQIIVTAKVNPYKLKQNVTVASFTMRTTPTEIVLKNSRKSVVPTIESNTTGSIVIGSKVYNISAGTHKFLDICLTEGDNHMSLVGNLGTVTFTYQEGDL